MSLDLIYDEILQCSNNVRSKQLVCGGAYQLDGAWTSATIGLILKKVGGPIVHSNEIILNAEGKRSNQEVALSLHQEDYHLLTRPKLLALFCRKNNVIGGETLVTSNKPEDIPQALRDKEIRFLRHSVGEWTPWRPILEVYEGDI